MENPIRFILLGVAGILLPFAYLALCCWLSLKKTWWFAYVAYFFLFGTAGGWVFVFAMSPSGIAAAGTLFLITVAMVSCLVSSCILATRENKGRSECIAMYGGFLYPVFLAIMLVVGILLGGVYKL